MSLPFKFTAMLDNSEPVAPTRIADRINRNQGTLFFDATPQFDSSDTGESTWFKEGNFRLYFEGGSVRITDGTNEATVVETFTAGQRRIVAATWDKAADVLTVYSQNVQGTSVSYADATPNSLLYVFTDSDPVSNPFVGDLHHFGIYDRVLSSADLTTLYNAGSGNPAGSVSVSPLVSFGTESTGSQKGLTLPISATTATNATVMANGSALNNNDPVLVWDAIGYGVWGQVAGSPTATVVTIDDGEGGNVSGLSSVGVGARLDGTNYFDGGNIHDVNAGDMVIACQVKTTSMAQGTICAKWAGAGNNGYRLYTNGSGNVVFSTESALTTTTTTSSSTIDDGKWHQITIVYDRNSSGNSGIYLDGKLDVNLNVHAGGLTNTDAFRVGAESDGGASNKFDGDVRDLHIYTSVTITSLNDHSRLAAYDLASQPLVSRSINATPEDGWYKFDDADFTTQADDSSGGANHLTSVSSPVRFQESALLSTNLIIDPTAENGGVGGWQRHGSPVIFSPNFLEKQASILDTDDLSFKVETTTNTAGVKLPFVAERGSTVRCSLRYNHENVSGTFTIKTRDTTAGLDLDGTVFLAKTATWKRHEWVVEIDNTGDFLHSCEIQVESSSPSGGVYVVIDDVRVERSLVPDGDCEATTGWATVGSPSVFTTDSVNEHSDTNAIEIATSSDGDGMEHAISGLAIGRWYEASTHLASDSAATPVDLAFEILSLSDATGDLSVVVTQDDAGIEYNGHDRHLLIFLTANDVSGEVRITRDSGSGTERWYTDDVGTVWRPSIGVTEISLIFDLQIYDEAFAAHAQLVSRITLAGVVVDGVIGRVESHLDAEDLTVFRASNARVELPNPDHDYNPQLTSNFFTDNGENRYGDNVELKIELGWTRRGTTEYKLVFCGFTKPPDTVTSDDKARILALDGSTLMRDKDAHNFGVQRTQIQLSQADGSSKYRRIFDFLRTPQEASAISTLFEISQNFISKESVENVDADGQSITIVPSIRETGALDYHNAEVDYPQGTLTFEDELPAGGSAVVKADWKEGYRYKRADFFARQFATDQGLSDLTGIEVAVISDSSASAFWSSHGRPGWEFGKHHTCRWVLTDWTNTVGGVVTPILYLLIETNLVKYDWNLDTYTVLAALPNGPSGQAMTGFQMDTSDFSTFFVLMTDDFAGDSTNQITNPNYNAAYKWSSGSGWTLLFDTSDEYPQLATPYDLGASFSLIADNRRRFKLIDDGGTEYLYFIHATTANAGVKRMNTATSAVTVVNEYLHSVRLLIEYGYDVIDAGSNLYHFLCYDDGTPGVRTTFEVLKSNLDGSSLTSEYSEQFTAAAGDDRAISATDLAYDATNDKIYFSLNIEDIGVIDEGRQEWCYVNTTGSMARTNMQSFAKHYWGPRGIYHNATINKFYAVTGCVIGYNNEAYPEESEIAGHLWEVSNGVATDLGRIWRSLAQADNPDYDPTKAPDDNSGSPSNRDLSMYGIHGGVTSNVFGNDTGTGTGIFVVAGFGELYDQIVAPTVDKRAHSTDYSGTSDNSPANLPLNFHLLQYETEHASKFPLLQTNDAKQFGLIETLAKSLQYETGFVCDRLIFRPRKAVTDTLKTAIAASGGITEIDLNDASRFPTGTALLDEVGHVIIGQEVFRYTSTNTTTDKLLGVTRAVEQSAEAAHSINDTVVFVHHFAFNHPNRENLIEIAENQPDVHRVKNDIKVNYDTDGAFAQFSDSASITTHGNHPFEIDMTHLGRNNRPWAEIVGADYLSRFATMPSTITLTIQLNPYIEIGQVVLVDQSERTKIDFRIVRALRVTHEVRAGKTTIEGETVE